MLVVFFSFKVKVFFYREGLIGKYGFGILNEDSREDNVFIFGIGRIRTGFGVIKGFGGDVEDWIKHIWINFKIGFWLCFYWNNLKFIFEEKI